MITVDDLAEDDRVRFWNLVGRSDGDACWLWRGGRSTKGYGTFTAAGRAFVASRLALELTVGPLGSEYYACHRCDNPPCCNPAHLFPGTHAENQADMIRKGRTGYRGWRTGPSSAPVRMDRRRNDAAARAGLRCPQCGRATLASHTKRRGPGIQCRMPDCDWWQDQAPPGPIEVRVDVQQIAPGRWWWAWHVYDFRRLGRATHGDGTTASYADAVEQATKRADERLAGHDRRLSFNLIDGKFGEDAYRLEVVHQ